MAKQDHKWRSEEYPGLTIGEDAVSGSIEFTATYDEPSGRFTLIRAGEIQQRPGRVLSGTFEINIVGSIDQAVQKLPLLFVENVDVTPDRHFNQADSSACVCSPLEANDFLIPQFEVRRFLEQLVIPFLYGQLFFDNYGRWPWHEYAHGGTGLLESYSRKKDASKVAECLDLLAEDWSWPKIKAALQQRKDVKGHMPCFCAKRDHIRRCHPDAWNGLKQLRHDIRSAKTTLPE